MPSAPVSTLLLAAPSAKAPTTSKVTPDSACVSSLAFTFLTNARMGSSARETVAALPSKDHGAETPSAAANDPSACTVTRSDSPANS